MKLLVAVVLASLALLSFTQVVEQKFRAGGVIPDILSNPPAGTPPMTVVNVTFNSGVMVYFGSPIAPVNTQKGIRSARWNANRATLYTFVELDADVPSKTNASMRPLVHNLIVNVPAFSNLTSGNSVFDFLGCGPAQGSGYHRYIFLVYAQTMKIPSSSYKHRLSTCITGRPSFDLKGFIKTNKLSAYPVAGNYFLAQFDSSVPGLYKTFKNCTK